ncbi:MAG: hypothetical protein IJR85_05835 [Synergistaceae bacterium]|nr:hypothetical protein [Synergistaceae bacterium]
MKKYPPLEIVAPLVFAFVFAVTLIYSRFEPHVEDVNSDYVKQYTGRPGYVLVDVRPEENFEGQSPMFGVPGGHIPGAINFPLGDLKIAAPSAALSKAGIVKDRTIILYCNTGTAAGKFADALIRNFNFSPSKLKNYRGSVIDWASYPSNKLLPEDHESGFPEIAHPLDFGGK